MEQQNESHAIDATRVTQTYDQSQIQVLEGLEAVRRRPGMYIGVDRRRRRPAPPGLRRCVDNAIDEAHGRLLRRISRSFSTPTAPSPSRDNGRGIPVGIHPEDGRFRGGGVPDAACTRAASSTARATRSPAVCTASALSVVNALSTDLEVEDLAEDGKLFRQRDSNGGKPEGPLTVVGTADTTGTRVTLHPDPEIFETLDFQFDTLKYRLRELAFLNAGLKITLEDKREGNEDKREFHDEGGIVSFVGLSEPQQRGHAAKDDLVLRLEGRHLRRDRHAVQRHLFRRRSSPSPTTSRPRRAASIWTASRRRSRARSTTTRGATTF